MMRNKLSILDQSLIMLCLLVYLHFINSMIIIIMVIIKLSQEAFIVQQSWQQIVVISIKFKVKVWVIQLLRLIIFME